MARPITNERTLEFLDDLASVVDEVGQEPGLGEKVATRLIQVWGGRMVYFPKGTLEATQARHRQIVAEFDGTNRDQLCRKYNISQQCFYRVLREGRSKSSLK